MPLSAVVRPSVRKLAVAIALVSISTAVAQQSRPTTQTRPGAQSRPAAQTRPERRPPATATLSMAKARQEFDQSRVRITQARQLLDRAAGPRANAMREQALADWRRGIDEFRPIAHRLTDATPAEQAMLAGYRSWRAEYAEFNGLGNVGSMFLTMQQRWAELTGGAADGWRGEREPVTYARLKEKPDDESNKSLGLPKTAAFARAADQYIREVRRMPAYPYFDDAPEVVNDLAQARAARDEARATLSAAAGKVIDEAGASGPLDQAGRDRLAAFVDRDLTDDLVAAEQVDRAEALIEAHDRAAHGEAKATEMRRERLARGIDDRWAALRARYGDDLKPLASPQAAKRTELFTVGGFADELGGKFRSDAYDLAVEVDKYPVAMRFDPALKEQYKAAMRRAGLERLPAGTTYEVVGRPAGAARIEEWVPSSDLAVRAVTQPSADNPEARIEIGGRQPTSRPTMSDAVVFDVYALRAGPIAIGVDPAP